MHLPLIIGFSASLENNTFTGQLPIQVPQLVHKFVLMTFDIKVPKTFKLNALSLSEIKLL
jgi:hypothetical protein